MSDDEFETRASRNRGHSESRSGREGDRPEVPQGREEEEDAADEGVGGPGREAEGLLEGLRDGRRVGKERPDLSDERGDGRDDPAGVAQHIPYHAHVRPEAKVREMQFLLLLFLLFLLVFQLFESLTPLRL